MDKIQQSDNHIEFSSDLGVTVRIFVLISGLFPLLAPYGLLIKPSWPEGFSLLWLFAVIISAGAIGVSIFFLWAALFGMSQSIRFDIVNQSIFYSYKTALKHFHERSYPFNKVEKLQVVTHEWTDGPPSYNIGLKIKGVREIEFGNFILRNDAEHYLSILRKMTAMPVDAPGPDKAVQQNTAADANRPYR